MRFAIVPVGLVALMLLVVVPVGGASPLQSGSSATYKLSVSISFPQPTCETESTGSLPSVIYCPMIATVPFTLDINGTLGWTATYVNSTTAILNVTRDVSISPMDGLTMPAFRSVNRLNESINLATRQASIMPFLIPEMEQALRLAQTNMAASLPSSTDWTTSTNAISSIALRRPLFYTMWWVNGTLQTGDIVPVLVFPTNVTGSTTVNVAGLGPRPAWNLTLSLPRLFPAPDPLSTYTMPVGDTFHTDFSFIYDSQSDLLLAATANIHIGFFDEVPYTANQCATTTMTTCTSTTSYDSITSGLDIKTTLTLSNTNLSLDQHVGDSPPPSTGDSPSSSGNGPGTGPSTNGGTNGGSTGGTTSNSGGSQNSGSGQSPGSQSTAPRPASPGFPWLYWILGLVAVAIVVTSIFFARRRRMETSKSQAAASQASS